MIRFENSHHSVPFNIFFSFAGNQADPWIGTKLQEVGSQCTSMRVGPSSTITMAGADMSYFWDMCSELFGEIKEDELVPGQFNFSPAKKLRAEAEKEETKVGEVAGAINPSGSTTKVYTDQLPVPHDLGVPADYLPHWESIQKEGAKGGCKLVSYYTCLFCDHRSQNRTSTITHTRHVTLTLW